jgi:lipid-binding SYLF domain-containing protein
MKRLVFLIVTLIGGLGLFCQVIMAEDTTLDERIEECKDLLDEVMQIPEKSIPTQLLSKAYGIAIFPSVVKGGFIIGGRFGRGIILHHDKKTNSWSTPSFYTIAGGSWGLQIGGQITDLVLIITSERGIKGLLKDKFTIGADASATAGPIGRNAEAATDLLLKTSILSYSRSRGLFIGVALDGAMLMPDKEANKIYYGREATTEDILLDNKVRPTKKALELIEVIKRYKQ